MQLFSESGEVIAGDKPDPLRPKGEVIPLEILAMREQIGNLNWVTCPKCRYRWRYFGKGRGIMCSKCHWSATNPEYSHIFYLKNTEKIINRVLEREKTLRKKGLCGRCGHQPLSAASIWLCAICLSKKTERGKNKRHLLMKNKICIVCRKRPLASYSSVRCEICDATKKERARKAYHLNKGKAIKPT